MNGPLRVLFIEDRPDQSTTFAMLLGNCGCQVVTAPNGADGISLAQLVQPHLVFVDLHLPGMDGVGVAKAILEQFRPTPLLVAITGFGEERRAAWHELGLDDYLIKPVGLDRFLAILLKAQHWREAMEAEAKAPPSAQDINETGL